MPIKNKKWRNNLLLFGTGFVLILLFEIIPGIITVAGKFFEMYSQRSKIEDAGAGQARLAELNTLNKEIMRQINLLVSDYNESGKFSSVINLLDDLTAENDVGISSIVPGKIGRDKQLIILPVAITLKSDYASFYGFISSLENAAKVVVIKSITIKPEKTLNPKLNITAELQFCLNLI